MYLFIHLHSADLKGHCTFITFCNNCVEISGKMSLKKQLFKQMYIVDSVIIGNSNFLYIRLVKSACLKTNFTC